MRLARVEGAVFIHAPLDAVYGLAKRVEDFPRFMPDLERITVLERRDGVPTLTEWVGVVEGRRVHWVEEDAWDDAQHLCRFRQREGDFDRYEGTWTFSPEPEGTRTAIVVDFEFDIPLIGGLLSAMLRVKMRENLERMLGALRRQLEPPS
ncbi:MAG TPA: SRPBCC family protein [bacterium]|nr:SRPBCC family protein [bacterium]